MYFLCSYALALWTLETAQKLREKNCNLNLIFITIAPEYVYSAFEVEAFHYILKPIDSEKLERTLYRAVNKVAASEDEFIIISQNRQSIKLMLSEIIYFCGEYYTMFL